MKRSLTSKLIAASGAAAVLTPIAARAVDYSTDSTAVTTTDTAAAGGILAFLAIIWMLILVVALALFVFWIVMLVDAFKRTNWKDDNQKTTWLVVLIVGFVLGLYGIAAIVYYFAVKRALDKGNAPVAAPVQPGAPTANKK